MTPKNSMSTSVDVRVIEDSRETSADIPYSVFHRRTMREGKTGNERETSQMGEFLCSLGI